MSDKVIGDYTAAISVDGSTNYLLIQPGGSSTAYKKINRNVFLGVTAQPADISTAQNITNKTLDNSNILTLRDDRFTLQDNGDVTRQATFQLSGITAGQTRVMTLPDANATLVGTATTQTLTNKTLTSPTINGGSISNPTLSVDTIAEFTSANGVTIDSLNIKDGKLNTSNSVITTNITDTAVTPAKLQSGTGGSWSWQTWTPSWSNLVVSGSTVTAKYIQIGKTVFYKISVLLAGGNAPTGTVKFSLPVTATSFLTSADQDNIGEAGYFDAGAALYVGRVMQTSTTVGTFYCVTSATPVRWETPVDATHPFTFANADGITATGFYEAA